MENKFNIVDKLSLSSFYNDYPEENYKNYKVKAALFLTYSVEPKVVLALIHSLFFQNRDEVVQTAKTREQTLELLNQILKEIGDNEQNANSKIEDKFAVFYNNGSRPIEEKTSVADALAMRYAYPISVKGGSFHPKVYIVKYGPAEGGGEDIYRFIIGSHNLASSSALEYGYCFDRIASGQGTNGGLTWLDTLLLDSNNSTMNYLGNKVSIDGLRVYKEITKAIIEDMPTILTNFTNFMNTVEKADAIYSPFVTKGKIDAVKKAEMPKIYTTHMELTKRGYQLANLQENNGEKAENLYTFYTFMPEKNSGVEEYYMPHYKIYAFEDKAYIGSLNFTESAFTNNKEVMVEISEEEAKKFQNTISKWYKENKYYYVGTSESVKKNYAELFKNLVRKHLLNGLLGIDKDSLKFDIVLEKLTNDASTWWDVMVGNTDKNILLSMPDDFNISIWPENYGEAKVMLWDSEGKTDKICSKKLHLEWKIPTNYSCKLVGSTMCFQLTAEGKTYAPCCFSYGANDKDEIKNCVKLAESMSFLKLLGGGNSAAESAVGDAVPGSISVERMSSRFHIYTLEELLQAPQDARKRMCNTMKIKLERLQSVWEQTLPKDRNHMLKELGCRDSDMGIWKRTFEQAKNLEALFMDKDNKNE